MNNSFIKALVAHTLCKYDVFLFGFLASIIKPIYFPNSDVIGSLAVFATFASGYLVRPLGAVFFSHIGDRVGRKHAYMLTIFFMVIPALIMGFLPSYETLGIAAPILLICARIIQGFGSGGEFSGVAVYGLELAGKRNLGLIGGLVRSVGFLGTAIGTGIACVVTMPFMPSWGWRLTFILGAVFTIISFLLRKTMQESEEFEAVQEKREVVKMPLLEALRVHKLRILAVMLVGACAYSFLYFTAIYMNTIYSDRLGEAPSTGLLISTGMMLLWMGLTVIAGFIADRVGIMNFLSKMLVCLIVLLPLICAPLGFELTITSVFFVHISLSALGALFFGPVPALFKMIFPAKVRYTGTALSNTLGQALIGGMMPVYATTIVALTGSLAMSGLALVGATLLGATGVMLCHKILKQQDTEELSLAVSPSLQNTVAS